MPFLMTSGSRRIYVFMPSGVVSYLCDGHIDFRSYIHNSSLIFFSQTLFSQLLISVI